MKKFLFTCSISIVVASGVIAQAPPPPPPVDPPDYRGPVNSTPVRPKQLSGGVLNGKALSLPKPEYPEAARAVKASGAITVQVLIDETGAVVSAAAVSGHPLLAPAAVSAARLAQFAPTTLSGQPVKVSGVITYNFVLDTTPTEGGLLGQIPIKDRDSIWGIGFLLAFVQAADAETIRMLGDENAFNSMLIDLANDVPPEMAAYKPVLDRLSGTDAIARSEAARDFLKLLRKEFNPAQNWQVDIGEQLGLTLAELVRQKILYVKTGTAFDVNIVRSHLNRISDLIAAAPEGASADNKAKFKKIAAFANAPDLAQDAKIGELIDQIEPLFAAFDDNK